MNAVPSACPASDCGYHDDRSGGYCAEGTGFGHLNAYALQFELQSVSHAVGKDLIGNCDSALFSPTPIRFPAGYFSGIVRSPSGELVKGIEVAATRTDEVPLYMRQVTKRTDESGGFQLDVPPGTYIVGINTHVPVVAKFPYPPTYFPGTTERTSATVLAVQDMQTIKTNLAIPVLAVRKDIAMHVRWPDGSPAGNVLVWLREVRIAHRVAGNGLVTHTDENGAITLPAFVGFTYTAHAETNVLHPSSYEHFCAQPVRIEQTEAVTEIVLNLSIKGEDGCRDSTDEAHFLHEFRSFLIHTIAPKFQIEGLGRGELLEEVRHPGFSVAVAALPLDLHDPLEVEIELYRTAF